MTGDLKRLIDAMPAEVRPQVERVLRHVAHDVRTPVSTIVMDVFSARRLIGSLEDSVRPESGKALADLAEICSNLEHASSNLGEYLDSLANFETIGSASEPPRPQATEGEETNRKGPS